MRAVQKHSNNQYALLVEFPKKGNVLELHEHDKNNYHNTVVISGKVACYGIDSEDWYVELCSGEYINFTDKQQHHEIKALEDNTKILNIYKEPQPHWKQIDHWMEW